MIMKHIYRHILLLAALAATLTANAARNDIHYISAWGGVGYSGLVNSYDSTKFIGGVGGMIGVGYEYHHKRFLLNTGIEMRMFTSKDKVRFPQIGYYDNKLDYPDFLRAPLPMYDQQRLYQFSNFSEKQSVGQLMIPVLAGMDLGKWYFLAGFKFGYTLYDNVSQKADLTTSIYDPMAFEEWYNITGHGADTDQPYTNPDKIKNKLGFDMTVSAEVGLNINAFLSDSWNEQNNKRKHPFFMRASLFIDYGLPNLNIGSDEVNIASASADAVSTTSVHQSAWADSRLNSLLVGAKFAFLLQMNKPQPRKQGGQKQLSPRMVVSVQDAATDKPLSGAKVGIYNPVKNRTLTKTTNPKGFMVQRTPAGNYTLSATRVGYLPTESQEVVHEEDLRDTIVFRLTPEPVFTCFVKNSKTGEPVAASLEFINTETGKQAATVTASAEGKAVVKLPYPGQYSVNISATDYLYLSAAVADQGGTETYQIDPIEKGKKIILKNLFFASNATTILPESEASLQELYEFLRDNEDVRIRIIGHTDDIGTEEDNQKLSEGRAASVKANIVERGIKANRIETEGHGELDPIATNETAEGRAQNRRVEFVIL